MKISFEHSLPPPECLGLFGARLIGTAWESSAKSPTLSFRRSHNPSLLHIHLYHHIISLQCLISVPSMLPSSAPWLVFSDFEQSREEANSVSEHAGLHQRYRVHLWVFRVLYCSLESMRLTGICYCSMNRHRSKVRVQRHTLFVSSR